METPRAQPNGSWFFPRTLPPAAAGLGLGVALSAALAAPRFLPAAGILLAAALLARYAGRRLIALFLLFASLGLVRAYAAYLPPIAADTAALSGRICETPERAGDAYTLTLDRLTVDGISRRGRAVVTLTALVPPVYGQTVSGGVLRMQPASYASDRYRGVAGYAVLDSDTVQWGVPKRDLTGRLITLRARAAERLALLFPSPEGLAAGILLGDKSGLSEETAGTFRASGLAHLLAVSGLHISILAAAVYAPVRFGPRFLRVAILFGLLLFYAALTAFSPSVLRASLMFLTGAAAFPLERRRDPASSLAAAFLLILLMNPNALFSAGFQLSFAAVYGILTLAPVLYRPVRRLGRACAATVSASAAASAATFPLIVSCFGQVPLFALFANFFALPLLPLFAVPALAVLLLSLVSYPLANAVAAVPRLALSALSAVVSRCPAVALSVPAPPVLSVLFYYAGLLFLSPYCRRPLRTRALICAACLVFSLLISRF